MFSAYDYEDAYSKNSLRFGSLFQFNTQFLEALRRDVFSLGRYNGSLDFPR
jgi:hypothetical protein